MRFESSELLPINAKIGTLVLFVISDFVCIELLKKSFSDKYKIGTNKVLKTARKYINDLFGNTGTSLSSLAVSIIL